ncbi:MAG: MerR family transcriptional regulator, partial [Clostridiales bacterium]|nr:MerR family transcriptional regulator [Clostridiales bacterium]
YTDEDIRQLKIIRVLRCANYSLEAIRRMMQKLSENPEADIREILDTPGQNDDIILVCDRLLLSLSKAEINAGRIMDLLKEMKKIYS